MNFFNINKEKQLKRKAPLATRMRPKKIEEFMGQDHIIGKNKLLYRAIKADHLSSLIFYGPPGTGKTTLAKIIAYTTKAHFEQLNAVTSGVVDIRKIIKEAEQRMGMYNKKTILFIDEIHRFNKNQQDALLPSVEEGIIILIGATTENPYFEVNPPLVSRSRIFELKRLKQEDIEKILLRALRDKEKGLGMLNIEINQNAIKHIASTANGDARTALNALELAALTTPPRKEDQKILIDIEVAQECIQKRALVYEKNGDNHYDTVSAFIKSIRGSDPDAALYWLAKMIYAGEDPKFIARRLIILASEDIGNADPQALIFAVSAAKAVDFVGFPEARIILAQAVTYLAVAPKSNAAYLAIDKALKDIETKKTGTVPFHLRDTHYKGAAKLGHGKGYQYPHDFEESYVKQQYLPNELQDVVYYHPTNHGYEKIIREKLNTLKKNQ
ncbi:AAA family ATPase [Garciella nitratireducens]|uniref:AAA family ATPase n=1 Tax=Garciella nitratireducens TaxID=218205 RepID=UPI00190E64AE|nr:AAA family ATPase [Garciella nitratireducens]